MLTDMALRRAKAQEKAYLLTDERGLYVVFDSEVLILAPSKTGLHGYPCNPSEGR